MIHVDSREVHERKRAIILFEACLLALRNGDAIPKEWLEELEEITPCR